LQRGLDCPNQTEKSQQIVFNARLVQEQIWRGYGDMSLNDPERPAPFRFRRSCNCRIQRLCNSPSAPDLFLSDARSYLTAIWKHKGSAAASARMRNSHADYRPWAELMARGAACTLPTDMAYGMREIVITTPDGHRIVFGQDVPR
jgi:hypothetical protein